MTTQEARTKCRQQPRRCRRDLLTSHRSRRDAGLTSTSTCTVFKYIIIWTTNTSPPRKHATCRQRCTDTEETSLRLVGADATPSRLEVPTCTLIMFMVVWTMYINLPRRHTACRQRRVNVDATHRPRVAPTRLCLNVKCPRLIYVCTLSSGLHIQVYPGGIQQFGSIASTQTPRGDVVSAPIRRCLNVELPHVSFSFTFSSRLRIYTYTGEKSTEAALMYKL